MRIHKRPSALPGKLFTGVVEEVATVSSSNTIKFLQHTSNGFFLFNIGTIATHIGLDPSWMSRIDNNVFIDKSASLQFGEHVESGLRDTVGGYSATEVYSVDMSKGTQD